MAGKSQLAVTWHCYISSSIVNWREKILKRYGLPEVRYPFRQNTLFFGLYHWVDWLKFALCQGKRKVFWCGSDILALEKTYYWKHVIAKLKSEHICENYVEQQKLREVGIEARVQQICLSTPYPELSYKYKRNSDVYICVTQNRESEYGLTTLITVAKLVSEITFHVFGVLRPWQQPNVVYYGKVSERVFNQSIKNFHACLRLNEFDGFGDALAKSALMGQWPISAIAYPHITHAPGTEALIGALKELKNKKEPNYEGREYWLKELGKNLV